MTLLSVTQLISDFIWGAPAIIMLLGVGLYLSIVTGGVQLRKIRQALKLLKDDTSEQQGEISGVQALSVALAGTVGAGNITGVAAAIGFGGPGAIFWMWVTAILGMATTYCCCTLAVKYREEDAHGLYVGGPMYVLKNALNMPRLGTVFSVCTIIATVGTGCMIPANAMMDGVKYLYPTLTFDWQSVAACLFALAVSAVVLGGVKSISQWMGKIVPVMCVGYLLAVVYILIFHFFEIPHAFGVIFNHALNPWAVGGGAIGSAIHYGVARGLFSNEAGQGSLPMVHALAKTKNPEQQGLIAMLGPLIDTLLICTLTALIIIIMGVYGNDIPAEMKGSLLALHAFQLGVGNFGTWIVAIALMLFSYSTIIAWCFYGEAALKYIFPRDHERVLKPYRLFYCLMVIVGALLQLEILWNISDIAMALMMLPNLLSLILLAKEFKKNKVSSH